MENQDTAREWLTQEQAADYIGSKPGSLRVWRTTKTGPAYHKRGGVIRYRKADLDAWLEAGRVDPSQPKEGDAQ